MVVELLLQELHQVETVLVQVVMVQHLLLTTLQLQEQEEVVVVKTKTLQMEVHQAMVDQVVVVEEQALIRLIQELVLLVQLTQVVVAVELVLEVLHHIQLDMQEDQE